MTQRVDVLVVGAGLSGIDAGYRLQTECPAQSYAILEARDAIGGTWDLFRYPGVRSDSDMFTLGYPFRPWRDAEGDRRRRDDPAATCATPPPSTASTEHIRFGQRVVSATWSTPDARWRVRDRRPARVDLPLPLPVHRLLPLRDAATRPTSRAGPTSPGRIVHPQHWPDDLDHAGKRVVVIGSGATAVTLVPALAETGRARDDAAALAQLPARAARAATPADGELSPARRAG